MTESSAPQTIRRMLFAVGAGAVAAAAMCLAVPVAKSDPGYSYVQIVKDVQVVRSYTVVPSTSIGA